MKPITYLIGDASRPVGDGQRVVAHVCNDYGAWATGFMLTLSQRCNLAEARYLYWFNGRNEVPRALDTNPFGLGEIQFAPLYFACDGGNSYVCNMVARMIGEAEDDCVDGCEWHYTPLQYDALERCIVKLGNRLADGYVTLHMPRIGNGADGGSWHHVKPLIKRELCARDIEVFVYDLPKESSLPTEQNNGLRLVPIESDALRAARAVLPERDETGSCDPL